MKTKLVFCISLAQVSPASLSVPDAIIQLSKRRIEEQYSKSQHTPLQFDSSHCDLKGEYQTMSDGILLQLPDENSNQKVFVSYQEIMDGNKIPFPKLQPGTSKLPEQTARSQNYNKAILGGLTLLAVGGAIVLYKKNRRTHLTPNEQLSSHPTPKNQLQRVKQIGLSFSF